MQLCSPELSVPMFWASELTWHWLWEMSMTISTLERPIFFFFLVFEPHLVVVKAYSWLLVQGTLLVGLEDHMGCQGFPELCTRQETYP